MRITHRVFFLGVREDPLNGFLSALVELRVRRRISGIVRQFLILLPDMPLHRFDTVLGMRTPFSGRTGGADIRITLVFPISITVRRAVRIAEKLLVRLLTQYFPLTSDSTLGGWCA